MSGFATTIALAAWFFAIGIAALWWPREIQRWVLSYYEGTSGMAAWNPLLKWMKTPSYVTSLRAVGLLAIAAGALFMLAIVRQLNMSNSQ